MRAVSHTSMVAHLDDRGVEALNTAVSTDGRQFRVLANRFSVSRSRCRTRRCASSAVSCTISAVAAGDQANMEARVAGDDGTLFAAMSDGGRWAGVRK
jgi:hypothetical protein